MRNMILDDERVEQGLAGMPVKIGTRIRLIHPANIVYAKASGDYVDIVLATGETLHSKEQITRLERRLPPGIFARVHRSYVVNTTCIKEIRARQNGYELVLNNGRLVACSLTYRRQVRGWIKPDPQHKPGVGLLQRLGSPEEADVLGDSLRLRPCRPGDEHRLALIGQATFMATFADSHRVEDILAHCATQHSPSFYRRWLEDSAVRIWVLEQDPSQAPVGYMAVTPADQSVPECGDDDLVLQRIYLREGWYDRCRKSRLFENAIRYAERLGCRRLWAWDFAKNKRVLEFYVSVGFQPRSEYMYRVGGG